MKTFFSLASVLFLIFVPMSGADPMDDIWGAVEENDFCDDDAFGWAKESYECPIHCEKSDYVAGAIQASTEVEAIWVGADCGTGDSANLCYFKDRCFTEAQTSVEAEGACSGWSRSGGEGWYTGTLMCASGPESYSESGSGFAPVESLLDQLGGIVDSSLSCDQLEVEAPEGTFNLTSLVVIWFEAAGDGKEGSSTAVQIQEGECSTYEAQLVSLDGELIIT